MLPGKENREQLLEPPDSSLSQAKLNYMTSADCNQLRFGFVEVTQQSVLNTIHVKPNCVPSATTEEFHLRTVWADLQKKILDVPVCSHKGKNKIYLWPKKVLMSKKNLPGSLRDMNRR